MSSVLDVTLVGVVIAASVGYAACSLGPRTLKPRVLAALAALLLRSPTALGLHSLARRLQSSAQAGTGSCGGCDNCGAASTTPAGEPAAGSPASGSPAAEIRVPLSSIAKRR